MQCDTNRPDGQTARLSQCWVANVGISTNSDKKREYFDSSLRPGGVMPCGFHVLLTGSALRHCLGHDEHDQHELADAVDVGHETISVLGVSRVPSGDMFRHGNNISLGLWLRSGRVPTLRFKGTVKRGVRRLAVLEIASLSTLVLLPVECTSL
jgi:hypothetical protein